MSSTNTIEPSRPRRVVGRVIGLWRYPVKSMAGETLGDVELSWHGLVGDRRWAFVRDDHKANGFPWLTIRQRPDMVHCRPRFVDPQAPNKSAVRVLTPSGAELDVTDPALVAELGGDVHLIKQDRGIFDTFPVSLITTQTIDALGALVGSELDRRRFRPNLLVSATGDERYPEDAWVGRVLRIGSAIVRIDKRDQRCVVVNIDPETTERDPNVLRAIATERDACLGVYGQTVAPGQMAVGDSVIVED